MAESERGKVQQSYLGEAAQRLYNALDLDGQISPQFLTKERIIPVVIVGDGLAPGMAQRRGRRWIAGGTVAGANNLYFRLLADAPPLIIERLWLSSTVNDRVEVYFDPSTASTVTGGTTALLDRTTGTREPVPGLQIATGIGNFGAIVTRISVAASTTIQLDCEFMLNAGALLQFDPAGAGTVDVTLFGRLF